MMRMLHFCGAFREWDGSEEEFPHLLSQYASFLPEEAVGRMFWIVGKAAYGPGKTTEEENAFVRNLYFQIADKACKDLGMVRKLVFRYGRAFG